MWLAPNLLTFVGFLFTVANWVLLTHYDYYYYASSSGYPHVPDWVWLACAINHFLAHTLGTELFNPPYSFANITCLYF